MINTLEKMRRYLLQIILLIAVIVALSSHLKSCNIKKTLLEAQFQNKQLLSQGQVLQSMVNEQGEQIDFQLAAYLDERSKNETLIERVTKLENTISEYKTTTITVVDSVFVEVQKVDTFFVGDELLVNYHFVKRDTNLFFKGFANKRELFIDSLALPNELTLSHKWRKDNFLAKKKYVIEVKNNNPYVQVIGLNNYTFYEEKKWHEKRGVLIGFGVVAGFLLNRQR